MILMILYTYVESIQWKCITESVGLILLFFLLLVDPNNIMELNFYTYMYIRVFVCVFLIYRITLKII